jgi:hypothetical protein
METAIVRALILVAEEQGEAITALQARVGGLESAVRELQARIPTDTTVTHLEGSEE